MGQDFFSSADLAQIAAQDQTLETVLAQLRRFAAGVIFQNLDRPCRLGDGIRKFSETEISHFDQVFAAAASGGRAMKFVPASGAGSRMFEDFIRLLHHPEAQDLSQKLEELPRYPFFSALDAALRRAGSSFEKSRGEQNHRLILECLLTDRGLGYAQAPKALIPFHAYGTQIRTPFEEHLVEAAAQVRDAQNRCRLHFTVTEEHEARIREFAREIQLRYERGGIRWELSFSIQKKSTDIIAADAQHRPFRDRQGRLHFRPGGHGALLENLNELHGDLVFLKNIDNVAPDAAKVEGDRYKRAMAGYLVELQERVFHYLPSLEKADPKKLEETAAFFQGDLSGSLPADWQARDATAKSQWLFARLNRPLRVCGMVPNQGEPGGAPFWVRDREGMLSLQIVESVQVNPGSSEQNEIFRSSTHFNPVDLVCGLRDFHGAPFDLKQFRDPDAGFISQKSHEGLMLRALELPGLWNGSMAYWNTAFVEVPGSTFTPVKKIEDLLRPEHQNHRV